MKMPNRLISTAIMLLLALPGLSLAAKDLSFTSVAEIEAQQTNDKGELVTVRMPAVLLQPGDIAIYTNSFTNVGENSADEVVIDNPVPNDTEYLGGSATTEGYLTVFSVDSGKSFGLPKDLSLPDGKGGKSPAKPEDYTNIRWTKKSPLQPGETGVVEFRVRVK